MDPGISHHLKVGLSLKTTRIFTPYSDHFLMVKMSAKTNTRARAPYSRNELVFEEFRASITLGRYGLNKGPIIRL